MAEPAQMVQGYAEDGDAHVSDELPFPVMGKNASGNYQLFSLDDNGQVELAHDVNTNPVFAYITDGDQDDLNVYNESDAADTGIGVMGKDSNDQMQFLKVGTDGELIISIGSTDSAYTYGTVTAEKGVPIDVVNYSPGSGTEKIIGVKVTGQKLGTWLVKFGTTDSEDTIFVFSTSPSSPDPGQFNFPSPLEVASTETILVEVTNNEHAASPASDMTAHASIIREA